MSESEGEHESPGGAEEDPARNREKLLGVQEMSPAPSVPGTAEAVGKYDIRQE